MKFKIVLMVLSILFSSCYSYRRTADSYSNLVIDGRYKIISKNDRNHKGKLVSHNDSILVLKTGAGKLRVITISDIQDIREGKFSYVKTIGYPLGSVLVVFGILVLATWEMNLGALNYGWQ